MKRFLYSLLGGRLQIVLVAAFSLVAALTVGLNAQVVQKVIQDYLAAAQDERVARDMDLADAFYRIKQEEIIGISHRLALDPWVIQSLPDAAGGLVEARQIIDQQITNKITVLAINGTHLIAVLDAEGNIVVGRVVSPDNLLLPRISEGNWDGLPIVREVLASGQPEAATEIIPAEFLAQVGLEQQASISLRATEKAAPELFDPREGTAGLALTGVYPLLNGDGQVMGAVLSAYLFNNDFTLVDRIKEVAGVDTVTIFFGDLRVSTNVPDEEGKRAVGTRLSLEVYDVVLKQGRDYPGEAFVVKEWFITRYRPLHDYERKVVGILYVGARKAAFDVLVQEVNTRVRLIAFVCLVLAGVIAVPIARFITRPIAELVEANRHLAQGDMAVRVQPYGNGELAVLGRSFNNMVETLRETQQELLHKENLVSMGQLAAGVAHELNNPLGTILLYSDVLYKEAKDDSGRDDLQMIIKETNRCKVIVRDLLNFARQTKVLAQPTDLNQLLEKLVAEQQKHPNLENIEIVLQLDEALPTIQADPLQLQQVFINLMNNAAEAMEAKGGGTLTITTRPVPFGECVEVSVADTGVGISEENKAKLFTPFFTTKPVGKGTGLGLAIVYGIIKMHRGQIQAQSEESKGTTLTITLPLKLPAAPEPAEGIGVS
jgi:two-component system NtrC family sensor kinase